jgi:hypothetical protein
LAWPGEIRESSEFADAIVRDFVASSEGQEGLMADYEMAFGDIPCLIQTRGIPPVATMFVIKDGGHKFQAVGDKDSNAVEFPASQEVDVYGRAVNYLKERFGTQEPAPTWPRGVSEMRIEDEPPLRDER